MVKYSRHYRSPGGSSPFSPGPPRRTQRRPGGGVPAKPAEGPQRGFVGPFIPNDPNKTRHYEMVRRVLGRRLGIALALTGAVGLWTKMREGTPVMVQDMDGVTSWSPCAFANIDGVHLDTIRYSCTHVHNKAHYDLTKSGQIANSDEAWTVESLEEIDPATWRVHVGLRWHFTPGTKLKVVALPTAVERAVEAAVDPFKLPINQPVPGPVAIPPGLKPYLPPVVRPEGGRDRTRPPSRRQPPVVVRPAPWPRRPQPREKEKKFKTQATASLFMWLVRVMNFGTEALDFLEAVWSALPRSMRSGTKIGYGHVTPQQAIQDIYDHFHELNDEIIGQAIANLIENQVEDALVGAFEREWAKANNRLGRRQTNRPVLRVGY